ncbi:putative leader peptide [Spongisporangium articulatum]|uniref:Leader peptide n=1 Tax=Spongisporangium articulatum TaxID=3362603 RepID=A0ABW8AQU4_9ACTN
MTPAPKTPPLTKRAYVDLLRTASAACLAGVCAG